MEVTGLVSSPVPNGWLAPAGNRAAGVLSSSSRALSGR
jgi:hypothetical protein